MPRATKTEMACHCTTKTSARYTVATQTTAESDPGVCTATACYSMGLLVSGVLSVPDAPLAYTTVRSVKCEVLLVPSEERRRERSIQPSHAVKNMEKQTKTTRGMV